MLLKILDANATAQNVIIRAQESIVDGSGNIGATGVSQILSAGNTLRSGFYLQNLGLNNMYFNDSGIASNSAGSILLAPGQYLSTMHNYPLSTNQLYLSGSVGDNFTFKQW